MSDILDIDLYREIIKTDLAAITSPSQLSPIETAHAVHKNGIVIFPAVLDMKTLQSLNVEFDHMLDPQQQKSLGFKIDRADNLVNMRIIRDKLDSQMYPVTSGLFSIEWMDEVAACYFGEGGYKLNDEIFVSDISETISVQTVPPFALHFDKRQVLKFFVYLTDTDESNGAMRAAPGSHYINREKRLAAMASGTINEIPNVLPEPEVPSIPITGPAGTLFVFDTDMAHGASHVSAGKTRRTMRGHTHSLKMLEAMAEDAARLQAID
ncbi:MAG: phytanoyl-CoA dioxygenase family protein [Rhodospirillaceae bacterium]